MGFELEKDVMNCPGLTGWKVRWAKNLAQKLQEQAQGIQVISSDNNERIMDWIDKLLKMPVPEQVWRWCIVYFFFGEMTSLSIHCCL